MHIIGTAQRHIKLDKFKEILIPIPTIEKQRQIVDETDFYHSQIKSLNQQIEKSRFGLSELMDLLLGAIVNESDDEYIDESNDDLIIIKN